MGIPRDESGIHKSRGPKEKVTRHSGWAGGLLGLGQTQFRAQVGKGLTSRSSWGERVEPSIMRTWLQENGRQARLLDLVLDSTGTLDYRSTGKHKSGPHFQATETEGRHSTMAGL